MGIPIELSFAIGITGGVLLVGIVYLIQKISGMYD